MGALAKALWRNQNLQPIADAVQGYLQKQQYNRDLQQLAQYQKDYEQGLTGAIQPKQQTVIKDIEAPMLRQENTDNKPFKVGLGVMPGSGISPLAKLTQRQYQPELVQTGMQTLPIETTEDVMPTVQEQRRAVNDQMLKYANNVFALEGLSPEKKQAAFSLAQMKANGYMPTTPQIKSLRAGEKLLQVDENGNIVELADNPKDVKPTTQKPTSYLLNNGDAVKLKNGQYGLQYGYVGEDGKTYVTETQELARPPKDAGNGGKGNQTLNLHDLVGKVKSDIINKQYLAKSYYGEQDPNKRDPEQKSKLDTLESEIQGNTDALVEEVDSSYPGFLDYISKGWEYPKGPKRDKYIRDISIPAEAKKYLKFYFDSRDRQ